jgi:hypothetical protein
MASEAPYISRQQAENFLGAFAGALKQPMSYPILFHVWGIGGVGKTNLLNRLEINHKRQANFARVAFFDYVTGIETPLKLMEKLYNLLHKPGLLHRALFPKPDPFISLYQKYQQTINQLQTQPVQGNESVTQEQLKRVKQLLSSVASIGIYAANIGTMATGATPPPILSNVTPSVMEAAVDKTVNAVESALTIKDSLQ